MTFRTQIRILIGLIVCVSVLFPYALKSEGKGELQVSFLDIGQGDSIFIQSPTGRQMLIDGGRDKRVLEKLRQVMPFGDTSIDVVIGTHPDADHIGGLVDVLNNYEVGLVFEPGSSSDSKIYQTLEDMIQKKNVRRLLAQQGMIIDLGQGTHFNILFPDQDTTNWETNDSSVVGTLTYGTDSFMFNGDSPIKIEKYLISTIPRALDVDVLKLGHHGSRTSSSTEYLEATSPDIAIISAGKNNSYGHPHKEVLDNLKKLLIPYLNTADIGTITFVSDGKGIRRK
jgi:competence protein ComEC